MKRLKEPNDKQKKLISDNNLVPDNWLILSESKTDLEIQSKRSGMRRVLNKKKRKKSDTK